MNVKSNLHKITLACLQTKLCKSDLDLMNLQRRYKRVPKTQRNMAFEKSFRIAQALSEKWARNGNARITDIGVCFVNINFSIVAYLKFTLSRLLLQNVRSFICFKQSQNVSFPFFQTIFNNQKCQFTRFLRINSYH